MNANDIKFLILIGVPTLFCLGSGLKIKREDRILNESKYYMDFNILLQGLLNAPLFLISIVYFYLADQGIPPVSKKLYYLSATSWAAIVMIMTAMHGIRNRKLIKNDSFLQLSFSLLICGTIGIVGVIVYCKLWGWK